MEPTDPSTDKLALQGGFERYRADLDEATAKHYGEHVMPRVGPLYAEDFEEMMAAGRVVLDADGQPLACRFTEAYDNYNQDQPELETTAYLMQPIWEVTADPAKLKLIQEAGYTQVIGEIVVPDAYDGTPPEDMDVWQNNLTDTAVKLAQEQVAALGAGAKLYKETGVPLLHYEYLCSLEDPNALASYLAKAGGRFIDTWSEREESLTHAQDITDHHTAVFAEHSRTSNTPFGLGLSDKEEVEAKLNDPHYAIVSHVNEEGKVDATVTCIDDIAHIPYLDPKAFTNQSGLYTEYLSSDPEIRGDGVAFALTGYGLQQFLRNHTDADPERFTIAFDTAGDSTVIIPHFAEGVITGTGFSVNHIRTQSLHHVAIDLAA